MKPINYNLLPARLTFTRKLHNKMKKILFMAILLAGWISFGQECSYGTTSDNTGNGGNISTGGDFEYTSASDFDIPLGTLFTASQVKFNLLKGTADLNYVNLSFLKETEGMPGEVIQSFENVIPVSQEFAYETEIEGLDAYQVTLDLPSVVEFPEGKYFLQLSANAGDENGAWWEIAAEETTSLGRFDFAKFGEEPWFGGFSYYDQVFEVLGACADTGEEQPDYGDECAQGNVANNHETGLNLAAGTLADDFVVEENTVFYLSKFKLSTLQLGNIKNANIKIRKSENNMPGEIVYSVENKGPKTENFFGYWPFEGFPLDVVAVDLEFEFDEPVELEAGTYFIEVQATPFPLTDFLAWEATSLPGIGGNAMFSPDQGQTWEEADGLNLIFDVSGFCRETLGTDDLENSEFGFYPNPVKDELNITSESGVKKASVYDVSGKLIMNSNSKNVNTSSLESGVYMVRVELENGQVETFKIIKK